MTSVYSVIAQEANYLVDGINSLYLKGKDLYKFDGVNEEKFEAGKDGKSAFDLWVEQQGPRYDEQGKLVPYTMEEFMAAIKGEDGDSAFIVWRNAQPDRYDEEEELIPYTYQDFIEAITGEKGDKGDTGETGADGKSAFEVWVEQQPVRYEEDGCTIIPYTFAEYLYAITGPTGPKGDKGDTGPQGPQGEEGKDSKGMSWWQALLAVFGAGIDAAEVAAAIYSISAIEAELALLQGQITALGGANLADDVMDAADAISDTAGTIGDTLEPFDEVSNVAQQQSRSLWDSLNRWLNNMRTYFRATAQGYQRITNTFTSPRLASVGNSTMLADPDLALLGSGMVL